MKGSTSLDEKIKEVSRERVKYIDVARGIAALLVVVGHSIQVSDSSFDYNIIFRLIYSFHMPLFMFLSGYVSFKSEGIDGVWLVNKAKRLVIPFVLWTILPVLFAGDSRNLHMHIIAAFKQPDISFWFLLILFYCDALLFSLTKIELGFVQIAKELRARQNHEMENPKISYLSKTSIGGVLLTISIIFLVKKTAYLHPGYGMALLSWHCIFFFFGYWISRLSILESKQTKATFIILALIWFPLALSWSRIKLPDYILQYAKHMNQHSFELLASLYNYIVAFAGIGLSIIISAVIVKAKKIGNLLEFIGAHTVEMYLMQGLFFNCVVTSSIHVNIYLNILFGVLMPLLICILLKKGELAKLFFGKKT